MIRNLSCERSSNDGTANGMQTPACTQLCESLACPARPYPKSTDIIRAVKTCHVGSTDTTEAANTTGQSTASPRKLAVKHSPAHHWASLSLGLFQRADTGQGSNI